MQTFEENQQIIYQFVKDLGGVYQDQLIRYAKLRGMSGVYVVNHLLYQRRLFLTVHDTKHIIGIKPNVSPPGVTMRKALWILLDIMSGRSVECIMPAGDEIYLLAFVMEDEICDICHVTSKNVEKYEKGVGSRFILVDHVSDINRVPAGKNDIFCLVKEAEGKVEYYERSFRK